MYEESIIYRFSGVLHINYYLQRLINCNRKPLGFDFFHFLPALWTLNMLLKN